MHSLREEGHFPDPRTTYSSPPSSSCLPFVRQRAKAQTGAVMSQVTQQDRDSSGEFPRGGRLLRSMVSNSQPPSLAPVWWGWRPESVPSPRKRERDHLELGWGRNSRKKERWGDGKLYSRGQVWESPRPEELGDVINVSGGSDFQAARSSVSRFHGGCWGVLRLEPERDGPRVNGHLGIGRVLEPERAAVTRLRGRKRRGW